MGRRGTRGGATADEGQRRKLARYTSLRKAGMKGMGGYKTQMTVCLKAAGVGAGISEP